MILTDLGFLLGCVVLAVRLSLVALDLDWTVFFWSACFVLSRGVDCVLCSRSIQPAYMRLKWRRIFVVCLGSRTAAEVCLSNFYPKSLCTRWKRKKAPSSSVLHVVPQRE